MQELQWTGAWLQLASGLVTQYAHWVQWLQFSGTVVQIWSVQPVYATQLAQVAGPTAHDAPT